MSTPIVSINPSVYESLPEPLRRQADQSTFRQAESSQDTPGTAGYAYDNNPNTIYLTKLGQNPAANGHPELSENAVVGHEAFHNLEANMPPAQRKLIPQSNEEGKDLSNPTVNQEIYGLDDLDDLRKQGKTITTIPNEKGAAIVQAYINSGGKDKKLQPWIDDLNSVKQSIIMPTTSGQKGINTDVRPPSPPIEMDASAVHNPPPYKISSKRVYNGTKDVLGGR